MFIYSKQIEFTVTINDVINYQKGEMKAGDRIITFYLPAIITPCKFKSIVIISLTNSATNSNTATHSWT